MKENNSSWQTAVIFIEKVTFQAMVENYIIFILSSIISQNITLEMEIAVKWQYE